MPTAPSDVKDATPRPWYHRQAGMVDPRDPLEQYDWIGNLPDGDNGTGKAIVVGRMAATVADYALIVEAVNAYDTLRAENARLREALATLAAQDSGIVGSTAKADCMAAYARVALKDPQP